MNTDVSLLSRVDHTLLAPAAVPDDIRRLCAEAARWHTAAVCVNPCYVPLAASLLHESGVAVCTVIGFPLGTASSRSKAFEAALAAEEGADECDMVIPIGALKAGELQRVEKDIAAVRAAIPGKLLKVIVEACLLTPQEKRLICNIVCDSGAEYIKTSTGFSFGGATFEDVALFAECCRGRCRVKAAGGISSIEDMQRFVDLGADRLGTSRAVQLFENAGFAG